MWSVSKNHHSMAIHPNNRQNKKKKLKPNKPQHRPDDNRWCKLCVMIIIIDCNCQAWFIFIQGNSLFFLRVFSTQSFSPSFLYSGNKILLSACVRACNAENETLFHVECIIYHFWIIAFDWRLLLLLLLLELREYLYSHRTLIHRIRLKLKNWKIHFNCTLEWCKCFVVRDKEKAKEKKMKQQQQQQNRKTFTTDLAFSLRLCRQNE